MNIEYPEGTFVGKCADCTDKACIRGLDTDESVDNVINGLPEHMRNDVAILKSSVADFAFSGCDMRWLPRRSNTSKMNDIETTNSNIADIAHAGYEARKGEQK